MKRTRLPRTIGQATLIACALLVAYVAHAGASASTGGMVKMRPCFAEQ